MTPLGNRLEGARVALGTAEGREVTWNDLERRASLGKGYLSKVRYGEREELGPGPLLRLANALGCDVMWLTYGLGEMYPARQLTARKPETEDQDPEPEPLSHSGTRPTAAID